ncbi:glycosyltransferase family 4 protein [Rhodanobacter lindaniclasticus]|uniref:glycosyltransferase family 4 protein n=1 Tax=Rhodanobacter lindaniclasticus TaxID=75310 RepID=UPI00109F6B02|nr:glycosyltransferase family 4 protein [Rhodanobacter lindaniclasticus]
MNRPQQVSTVSKQRRAIGIALLNLSAWIRRQPWLKAMYRHFPARLRNRTSEVLVARAGQQLKFARTAGWAREPRPPEPVAAIAGGAHAGASGVNIFAYARGQFGLAEGARQYARALLAEGYPVAIHDIDIDIPHGMDDRSLDPHIGAETPYGVNLIFVNPDYLEQATASIGRERLGDRHTIACWFWELEKFPDAWRHALDRVDEVMVSTGFIRHAVAAVTDKPVWSAPLPIGQSPDSGLTRADFGLDEDDFIFLCSFDFNSYLARKNPRAAIDAFRRAFADRRPNVKLLVKSSNGHRHSEKLRVLLNAVGADERIIFRDDVIDREDLGALQRCVDAYVSLHRAEGFGLGLAECMRLGKPAIATAWSGNMEFMTADNSCLVDYQLVPVGEGEYPHPEGQCWAEANVDQAAELMRRLVEDPGFAGRIGTRAAHDIRTRLSPHAAAQEIIRRIESRSSRAGIPPVAAVHSDGAGRWETAP